MDRVRAEANTPVKANIFLLGRDVPIRRDSDSPDTKNAGNEVFLNIFEPGEIAGGTSVYQIAEQVIFDEQDDTPDRRGDVTLLINGIPVIHIELKASGVEITEATNQIKKYIQERKFKEFMGLVQVFWAITPEDALYFAHPGEASKMNPAFFFRWGDCENNIISNWKELIGGSSSILSIPEAHQMIGYYAVADKKKDVLRQLLFPVRGICGSLLRNLRCFRFHRSRSCADGCKSSRSDSRRQRDQCEFFLHAFLLISAVIIRPGPARSSKSQPDFMAAWGSKLPCRD